VKSSSLQAVFGQPPINVGERRKLRFQVRPVLRGQLGRVLGGAYVLFAVSGPGIVALGVGFAVSGVGIGCAETAEHAAVAAFAPEHIRSSAFGLLATVQAGGNVAAGVVAGVVYTFASPAVAFGYLAVWMVIAFAVLGWAAGQARRSEPAT
jgi:hypothetical protein